MRDTSKSATSISLLYSRDALGSGDRARQRLNAGKKIAGLYAEALSDNNPLKTNFSGSNKVDGGRFVGHDERIDHINLARRQIEKVETAVRREIGDRGWSILIRVCYENDALRDFCGRYGDFDKSDVAAASWLLRKALDICAGQFSAEQLSEAA